jgi:hypothetical protein
MSDPTVRVLSWDWREQPDLTALARDIADLSGGRLYLAGVDTGSDEYAVVLSTAQLDKAAVDEAYRRRWEGEDA